MSNRSTLLLEYHLKEMKLPSFLREYGKMAAQYAAEGVDHPGYLLRLAELELIDRHQRMVERRIRAARFPAVKSLDTFDRNCSELRGSEQPAAFQEGIETSSPPGAKEGCQGHLAVGALP